MSTYVLVPGGFLGGWACQRVARRLRAQGHEVYAITLTGLGDRAHLGAPGLECHVVDVLAVLEAEDLRDVVLVGHSYGGVVITAVAARAPERVAHLAYIDAKRAARRREQCRRDARRRLRRDGRRARCGRCSTR